MALLAAMAAHQLPQRQVVPRDEDHRVGGEELAVCVGLHALEQSAADLDLSAVHEHRDEAPLRHLVFDDRRRDPLRQALRRLKESLYDRPGRLRRELPIRRPAGAWRRPSSRLAAAWDRKASKSHSEPPPDATDATSTHSDLQSDAPGGRTFT